MLKVLLRSGLAGEFSFVAGLALLVAAGPVSAVQQRQFATPEEASAALLNAIKSDDMKAMLSILGPEAKPLIDSGDKVADRTRYEQFVRDYEAAHSLEKAGDNHAILQVGTDNWPFPIPLLKKDGTWYFDTPAGKEEILARRIGRNELSAIEVCLAYVDAEREYYTRNPDGDALPHYAPKLHSTKGKHDGLQWDTAADEAPSPLGNLVAGARAEGYDPTGGKPAPYHGYYYRILTAQGPDAPGGAYDYMAHGKMIGGFALVAYPATYANSGVMTFIVNQDGAVYQKDLGPQTAAAASAMKTFNPDGTWKPVEDEGKGA